VADSDNDPSNGLTPSCVLIQEAPGMDGPPVTSTIKPCSVDVNAGTWDFPGANDDVCYRMLTDNDTPTDLDDISDDCFQEGWNLEFVIERRPGKPPPGGTVVRATCQLSENKPQDCPLL